MQNLAKETIDSMIKQNINLVTSQDIISESVKDTESGETIMEDIIEKKDYSPDEFADILRYIATQENIARIGFINHCAVALKIYVDANQRVIRITSSDTYKVIGFNSFTRIVSDILIEMLDNPKFKKFGKSISKCSNIISDIFGTKQYHSYIPKISEKFIINPPFDTFKFKNTKVYYGEKYYGRKNDCSKLLYNEAEIIDHELDFNDKQKSILEDFIEKAFVNYEVFKQIVGYLSSKMPMRVLNKMVLIEDEKVLNTKAKNGRRGKSLAIEVLKRMNMLSCFSVSGKGFDIRDKFNMSGFENDPSTCVFIDDVDHTKFDVEYFFNSVSSNTFSVESKNKNRVVFDFCPKIIVTSNDPIKIEGSSFEQRSLKIIASTYFLVNKSPDKEYGGLFVDDWDEKEINRAYLFILKMVEEWNKSFEIKQDFYINSINQNNILASIGGSYEWMIEWCEENIKEGDLVTFAHEKYVSYCEQNKIKYIAIHSFSQKVQRITGMVSFRAEKSSLRTFKKQ